MTDSGTMLSVVIISHNQCNLLRRCIDSVLNQKTSFPVQIIVSDDRSTDGTREMLTSEYKGRLTATFYDSTKAPTSITLERASFNRLNGLKYAKGKYLIHIDGDDFFTGTDLFQAMVDKLESNPECDACCQNFCWIDEDKLSGPHTPSNNSQIFTQECVITPEVYCKEIRYLPNSCFCVRRKDISSLKYINGIPYDDCAITARYLSGGKIAVLNRCDFIYVRYPGSSFNIVSEEDRRILFQPGIQQIMLTPNLAGEYLKQNVGIINYIAHKAVSGIKIPNDIARYYAKQPIFLYKELSNNKNIFNRLRYLTIFLLTYFIQGSHTRNKTLFRMLHKLAIGKLTTDVKI